MDEEQQTTPSSAKLRPAKFGGVRREDVSHALADLAKRNVELSSALATAQANEASLLERLRTAEDTLETFHATLEQASHLLAMAEERARDIRLEAERDAGRIRAEASEMLTLAEREIDGLESKKRQAVAALLSLRSSLTEVLPGTPAAAPAPAAPAPEPEAAAPLPAPVFEPAPAPVFESAPAPVFESAPAPVFEPAPMPEPSPEPELTAEPVSFPEPPPAPHAHMVAVPDLEPLAEPETVPEPAPVPEPQFDLPAAASAAAAPVRSLEALYLESLETNRRS